MSEGTARGGREPESMLVSAVVRVIGPHGVIGGAGFFVAPDLVLTCAHVVSDALGLPRAAAVDVGTEVVVDLPLADGEQDAPQGTARVWRWVPIRADQTGDLALLRLAEAIPGARPLSMADADGLWDHGARVVGFTDDHPGGIWHEGRFRGPTGQGWVQLSRADGQAAHVKRGFSGSPAWDDDLGAAVGLVVAAQPVREAQQAFVIRTGTVVREIPELAEVLRPAAPFRGLATFREADAEVFFGREEDVTRVATALRGEHPIVTVYGPSGCGKSSLALAGVVPAMRQAGHEVLVIDAGRVSSARAALATELFEAVRSGRYGLPRAESADHVAHTLRELGLTDTFHRVTGRAAARRLVVLDQAEALLNQSESELTETVELLFPHRPPAGLRVLATLRADFMDAALSHPQLGPVLNRGVTLPLTPMTRAQLHRVITKPLRRTPGVDYDPGLEQRILNDAGAEPGALPLLSFVLAQLWERRAAGRLRAATYEDLGGVRGALRCHAEQAWRECVPPADEAVARRLLSGLVRVLPGGEAPMRRVLTRDEAGEERWRLAGAFADRRLLVLSGGAGRPESAELAHEALITAWPTLAEQVGADADFLAGRAEVQHDLERWRRGDRSPDLLPGALQLAAVAKKLGDREADLTEEQREFLTQARHRQRAQRVRVRLGRVAVALVLAVIAGLSTFLVQESRVSSQREAEGRSRSVAVQSDELTRTNVGQAALAALAAYEIAPTQEARNALMRRYLELKDAAWALTGVEGTFHATAMSGDGAVTLVTTRLGRATLFLRTADGRIRQEQLRLAENAVNPVVSRDGRRIAYQRSGRGVVVWHDVTPSGEQPVGPAHPLPGALDQAAAGAAGENLRVLNFSADARWLVGVSGATSARPAQVWDLETGRLRTLPKQVTGLSQAWFGPDGSTLVAIRAAAPGAGVSAESSVVAVDLATGGTRELASFVDADYSGASGVSGDGSVIVVCRNEESDSGRWPQYRAIRVTDGRVLRHYRLDESLVGCRRTAVDEKGERFLVSRAGGEWDLVATAPGQDGTTRFLGPESVDKPGANLPLLGTAEQPVVVSGSETMVAGWTMGRHRPGDDAYGQPKLLSDGSTMVVRLGPEGRTLRVMETEGEERTLAEVTGQPAHPPTPGNDSRSTAPTASWRMCPTRTGSRFGRCPRCGRWPGSPRPNRQSAGTGSRNCCSSGSTTPTGS